MEETISKESQSPGYLVSEFTGVRSKKSQTISIKQYLDKVRSDEFKEKVLRHRLLRQQPGHEAEAQAIKSKMPCIIPAGICQGGHAASQLVQLSLITSVDLDDTNERTDEIFESLKELPYLKVLHRSISGTGLKAFLCISISNPDQYSAIYAAVSAEISQYAQHPCDKKCKDITRPCFYSWDPEAYYNPTATSYSLPEATAAEEEGTPNVAKFHPLSSAAPGATPAEGDNPAAPGFLAQFVSDFEHRNPFMRGERNDIALKLGRASRSKGFSSEELESIISVFSKHWSNSDFTADDIRKRVQAGYQFVNKQQSSEKPPFQGSQGSRFTMNPPRQERTSEDEDVLLENNNKLRSAAPYFPEEVYLHLPRFLQECVKYAANPREKDIMLLGSLNNCSACLPGTRFIYKNAEHSTHFYSAVPASAAAGKSAIGFTSYLMDAIQEMPVIAAVKDDAGLCNALTNENIRVVFVLYGDICNIASIVRRIHEAGRFAAVHVDLIAGLAGKEGAVDFIRSTTEADGIISTRQSFIRRAKELGLAAILRVFLLDSIALESLDKIPPNLPDCLDLLPGTMPKILRRVCATAKVPVLAGGLIADKEDVMAALEAGITAISTTNQAVWDM